MLQYTVLPQGLSYSRVFSVKPIGVTSLYSILSNISDPRRAQGKRHPLEIVLALALLAMCCGQVGYEAIEEWVDNYQNDLKGSVPFLAGHLINASTFQRVFSRLDVLELEQVLSRWLQIVIPIGKNEPIALDGKTLSGLDCHLLSAFAHQALGVLFELGTETKGKEIPLAHDLLAQIPVKNHIITADALHTQRKFCEKVTALEGGYCLTVKGNQEQLEKDLRLFFQDLPQEEKIYPNKKSKVIKTKVIKAAKSSRSKGKLITHTIVVSSDLIEYLNWPGLTHIWQLTREATTIKTGKTTTEVVVGIARLLDSTKPEQELAEQIIDLVRGHWNIENRLHRQRDVIFLEDRSTIRTKNAPQVMAALKNVVISLYHKFSVRYFPTAFRRFLASPEELFELLGLTNVVI